MWADVPTKDYQADRERGKQFATLTLRAMIADKACHGRALEIIFESIIEDAARRRAKGGKGVAGAACGRSRYLEALTLFITGVCLRRGPDKAS
jgi:hypothetical protein